MSSVNGVPDRSDIAAVVAEMRALAERSAAAPGADAADFGTLLAAAVGEVNGLQQAAAAGAAAFERGDPAVDLAEVMVGMQKARVAFEATTQVRNRLVAAYQEIMSMPL